LNRGDGLSSDSREFGPAIEWKILL
jgi:hypothetical protein